LPIITVEIAWATDGRFWHAVCKEMLGRTEGLVNGTSRRPGDGMNNP
jgi:hypothetical protein